MSRPSRIRENAPDGTPVSDAIVTRIRAGAYFENACQSVGIPTSTAYDWLRWGAEQRKAVSDGKDARTLTADQKRYVAFSEAVDAAEAEWAVRMEAQLESVARGGHVTETTTVSRRTLANGQVETTETTRREVQPPDPRVIQWRLERRFPERYGKRTMDVNVGGQVGNPVQVQVEVSAAELAAKLAAVKDGE